VRGEPVAEPETVATAIRIGRPASWDTAVTAVRESAGSFRAVSDAQILEAYREIARREGVFCEPASAAGVAGLRAAVAAGEVDRGSRCVCVLTGHGLKDPDTALGLPFRVAELPAEVEAVARGLWWVYQVAWRAGRGVDAAVYKAGWVRRTAQRIVCLAMVVPGPSAGIYRIS